MGFTGIYIFLFLLKNIDCGYSQSVLSRNMKNINFYLKNINFYLNFQLLLVKFSIYLNRRVFVMLTRALNDRMKNKLHPWLFKIRRINFLFRFRICAFRSQSSLGAHVRHSDFVTQRDSTPE